MFNFVVDYDGAKSALLVRRLKLRQVQNSRSQL